MTQESKETNKKMNEKENTNSNSGGVTVWPQTYELTFQSKVFLLQTEDYSNCFIGKFHSTMPEMY